jgi:two-component system LytT family response regulator
VINCVIIDDEPLALDLLVSYIEKVNFLHVTGTHTEPLQTLPWFDGQQVDLLFIDIRMPDISGIEFFRSLPHKPEVIFTTAFSEYALQGFDLNAVDYLLKPISFERFLSAVVRARDFIEFRNSKPGHHRDYFFINASHKIHKVFYNDILYLEGMKDYTRIHLAGTVHPLLILQNLKYFEDSLPKDEFVRVHRSYIVPIKKLDTITKKLVSIGTADIPVSDNYRAKLFSLIEK